MRKAAPQAPEVLACGAAFAVCGALRMEQAGTGCVIAPDSTEGMATLTKDRESLEKMYRKGWQDAEKLVCWYKAQTEETIHA